MKPEMIRVEPYSTWLESWKAPTSAVSRANGFVFVSGMPPYDPETGQVIENATIAKQTELVLEQMKKCLEAAGSDLDHVVKVIVYSARADKFAEINAVWLLLDSRVVVLPIAYHPNFVMLSSLNLLFFNSLKNALCFSDNMGA